MNKRLKRMVELEPTACPFCKTEAVLKSRISHYRRGKRRVAVGTRYWECPLGCIGPDGEKPFQFHDAALLQANDEAARKTWKLEFNEEMPGGQQK